ncbi:MAG: hypothetical protein ACO3QC_03100 [Phycisphaerales bacterium]
MRMPAAMAIPLLVAACAAPPHADPHAQTAAFPRDWLGSWSGTLLSHTPEGEAKPFTMRLDIAATADPSRFSWTITYERDEATQVRPYQLVVRDGPTGDYAIDERNGIVLDMRFIAGALHGAFDIAGSRVTVREELMFDAHGARIDVEMATARDADARTTGPAGEVRTLAPVSVQRGSLRRVPAER